MFRVEFNCEDERGANEMSGDPLQEMHEKKIVRFTVSWLKEGELLNRSRKFKCSIASTRCRDEKIKKGFTGVGMFRNTKTHKTERKEMKTIFFDVETSGTDDKKNGILQLAAMVECGGQTTEVFSAFVKPFPEDVIEDSALKANGIRRSEIESFADPNVVYGKLTRVLNKYVDKYDRSDKITLVGYNSRFDDGFLRQWFHKCGADKYAYGSYFFWPAIDVSNMVAVKYREKRNQFKDFKLMTIAKKLGIKVNESQAHNAEYDTMIMKAIYEKCLAC